MKFELKDFQVTATKALLDRMLKARDAYYRDGDPTSCCLASPTGSGKTIMVAAAVEAIFNGNPEWGIERDPFATVGFSISVVSTAHIFHAALAVPAADHRNERIPTFLAGQQSRIAVLGLIAVCRSCLPLE